MAALTKFESLIFDIKLSTVVPASITGEDKSLHQFTAVDLAMKLHHVTMVHFFGGDAAAGLSIQDLKAPMFWWLQLYYPICGRIRRHVDGSGRPFLKCNDSGVRIVEAKCAKTVAEWLEVAGGGDRHGLLVYHQPLLAREYEFTPLVFLQITRFKCGGISVGMRWAHILGDAFSASECINTWSKIMAANQKSVPSTSTTSHLITPKTTIEKLATPSPSSSCRAVKPLDLDPPLGDNWLTPNTSNMQTHTFHFTAKKLSDLVSSFKVTPFEVISAIVWKSMAKTRGNEMIITVCKRSDKLDYDDLLGNTRQLIGVVEAPKTGRIGDADFLEIAKMIGEDFVDETSLIEQGNYGDGVVVDFLVYGGSNLTFVDLEEVDLQGLKMNGRAPIFADVSIGGVGDEGAVVVVQDGSGGRIVNVVLRDDELQHLKNELRVEYDIL